MNKFFSVAALSLLITSATKNEAMAKFTEPLAHVIHKNPTLAPALALGLPFAASLLYNKALPRLSNSIQKTARDWQPIMPNRLSGGFRKHPVVATLLALVAGVKFFEYCPKLREALIDAPLKNNPWLTAAMYGGAAAYVFGEDLLAKMIPDFGSKAPKGSTTTN